MPRHHSHVFDEMVHKAFSSHIRRDILVSLSKKQKYLTEIAGEVNKKPQTVDFHLNILAEIGLVESEWIEGKKYYRIKDKKILEFLERGKPVHAGFRPKPPHEIVLDVWDDIKTRLDMIDKRLDTIDKKLDEKSKK